MKFTINRSVLLRALRNVTGAISNDASLPILSGIKIHLKDDCLTITASDGNLSIQDIVLANKESELNVVAEGGVVLESRIISEVVSKLDSDHVTLEILNESYTRVTGGEAEFEINGSKLSSYPNIEFIENNAGFNVRSEELVKLITQTSYAAGVDQSHPALVGIQLKSNGTTLSATGCDIYRLAKSTIQLSIAQDFSVTIPTRTLKEVGKLVKGTVTIAVTSVEAQFKSNGVTVKTRLIDGMYPAVDRLIANQFNHRVLMDCKSVLGSLERASLLKEDGFAVVKFEIESGVAQLRTKAKEVGASSEKLQAIECSQETTSILFNARYLSDAVKSIKGNQVLIQLNDSVSPLSVTNPNDSSVVNIITPVRPEAWDEGGI